MQTWSMGRYCQYHPLSLFPAQYKITPNIEKKISSCITVRKHMLKFVTSTELKYRRQGDIVNSKYMYHSLPSPAQ